MQQAICLNRPSPQLPPGGRLLNLGAPSTGAQLWVDGTVKKGRAAAGAVYLSDGVEREFFWTFETSTNDSTAAELMGLDAALQALHRWEPCRLQGLLVLCDSYQALEHLEKARQGGPARYAVLPALWERLLLGRVFALQNVERKRNHRADALARKALGLVR